MRKLELKYKVKMGSGYPSDPVTINFLKNAEKFPFIRTTWETYKNVLKEREQGHLGKWL
jgi:ribonuclease HII